MIERVCRIFKTPIRARQANWFLSLPLILQGIIMKPGANSMPPFTVVTGTEIMILRTIIDNQSSTNQCISNVLAKHFRSIDFFSLFQQEPTTLLNLCIFPYFIAWIG